VLVGTVSVFTVRHEVRDMFHRFSGSPLEWRILFIEGSILNIAGWAVSWIALSFAFACTCAIAPQITRNESFSASAACQIVLRRFASFLKISLSLFLVFGILFALGEALTTAAIFRFLGNFLFRYPTLSFAWSLCVYAAIGLVVSRFALAVPAVVLDSIKVGQSFFYSDELTEKKWIILAILLVKSVLGGYVAGMLPFWLAGSLPVPEYIWATWWFSWVLTGASILAVSWVEPIMFIGFALLYEKTCGRESKTEFQADARAAVLSS